MKATLKPGLTHELKFRIPDTKTVPHLYPESPEFRAMPEVFATGYMVGLIEWACIIAINPHIDWPATQTVGTRINVDHTAATPPGFEVCAKVRLVDVDGRRLVLVGVDYEPPEPLPGMLCHHAPPIRDGSVMDSHIIDFRPPPAAGGALGNDQKLSSREAS